MLLPPLRGRPGALAAVAPLPATRVHHAPSQLDTSPERPLLRPSVYDAVSLLTTPRGEVLLLRLADVTRDDAADVKKTSPPEGEPGQPPAGVSRPAAEPGGE